MPPKQKYTDPKLRDEVKEEIQEGDKGGAPGQWSARKAQMMAKEYKKRGGDYNTPKSAKDESQKHLDEWGEEDWQTKEGSGEAKQADGSRKRYLPKKAWEQMSEKEKSETDQKKQEASKQGTQYVSNTRKAKTARKEAQEDDRNDDDKQEQSDNGDEGDKAAKQKRTQTRSQSKSASKDAPKQNGRQSATKSKDQDGNNRAVGEDDNNADSDTSEVSSHKENESPLRTKKRTRKQTDDNDKSQDQKKQKTDSANANTIGSKHDKSTPPAKQGSNTRLPKKGQKSVHWKAMPGWVEGEVVEIVKEAKDVDGKKVKATKKEPKVVLKSKSSGKICVHKADNVYFD